MDFSRYLGNTDRYKLIAKATYMIHIYIGGRLGNQLFQYAFVRMLQYHNPNEEVAWHWDRVLKRGEKEDGWENSLVYFNTVDTQNVSEPQLTFIQKVCLKLYWLKYPYHGTRELCIKYQRRWGKLLGKVGVYYNERGYFPFQNKISRKRNILIRGYFESPKYFAEIDHLLRKEIQPKFPLLQHNQSLMHTIEDTNSICVSIRRGDFVTDNNFRKRYYICDKRYIDRAIEYMQSNIQNPVFIFFSDDIEWVKKNLLCDAVCFYERGDDPVWEKLRLMYSCKHFIISNSTFSWWAQHLGQYEKKMVVAPAGWYNSPIQSDLYEENWIKIAVD